jgi:hypothetical protein
LFESPIINILKLDKKENKSADIMLWEQKYMRGITINTVKIKRTHVEVEYLKNFKALPVSAKYFQNTISLKNDRK